MENELLRDFLQSIIVTGKRILCLSCADSFRCPEADSFVKNLNRPKKDAALAEKIQRQQDKHFHVHGYRRMCQWLKNSESICRSPKAILYVEKKKVAADAAPLLLNPMLLL